MGIWRDHIRWAFGSGDLVMSKSDRTTQRLVDLLPPRIARAHRQREANLERFFAAHRDSKSDAPLLTIEQSVGPPNVECPECLGEGWTCEYHVGKPWSALVGDERGCKPDCAGPGVPCRCRPGVHGRSVMYRRNQS